MGYKIKIVFSSNSSWSVYNFRLNLLLDLSKRGYNVIIVAPPGEYLNKLKENGFEISPIEINNYSKGILDNLYLIYKLYIKYKYLKPDIVLHNAIKPNIYGSLVCGILKIPVINNISGLGSLFISDSYLKKIAVFFYRLSQKKAFRVFFQNKFDFDLFLKLKIINTFQAALIPGSGVDLERFKPQKKLFFDNTLKFCFVGRLIKDKGIYEYIQAAEKIKEKYINVEFYILGEMMPQNPNSISQIDLNNWHNKKIIHYLGKTDFVENELNKFDCVVLPSYREGLSRVLLEASSMAIPIITTNVPGCVDVVENNINGFVAKVKDVDDLILQIEKIINLSKIERDIMGENGRKIIENKFDEKIVINTYLKTINEILKKN
jgi:glycosyltransferase involved in cell wall biosynthesis